MAYLNTDLTPLWLSFQLAGITTVILLAICTPLAWWLAQTRTCLKPFLEALLALPLVLPPTVLGFYQLLLLNPASMIGHLWFSISGDTLLFNFSGLVIGSLIYSLPFALRPLQAAFESIDRRCLEAAATLRASPWDRLLTIVLPMSRQGFISAAALCFAHTLGEFGVVLMLGGNIPGKTRTISIAIYDHVEQMNYVQAHTLSAILVCLSFMLLAALFARNRSSVVRSL